MADQVISCTHKWTGWYHRVEMKECRVHSLVRPAKLQLINGKLIGLAYRHYILFDLTFESDSALSVGTLTCKRLVL
jgi:hypothetical protein